MKIPTEFNIYLRQLDLIGHQNLLAKIINFSWFKFFKFYVLKKINFIRPINKRMYKDLIDLKYPVDNIVKIPNGINSKEFLNYGKIKHPEIRFGFVGRLTEIKNLIYLLDVFKSYFSKYPEDMLYIYGRGPEEKNIIEFIRRNKLTNNILLMGFEEDKKKIYPNIDVLLNSSFGEGISNVILEAMCTETFVIASNVGGNRELIKHKITGLLFK